MQNNHRRFNQCRFKISLAQTLCQIRAFNLFQSISFNLIVY